ncbi:MAG: hypothetical protein NVSMB64_18290 [Candidatus Velthaea sp.]
MIADAQTTDLSYGFDGAAGANKSYIAIIFPIIVTSVIVGLSLLADIEVPDVTLS